MYEQAQAQGAAPDMNAGPDMSSQSAADDVVDGDYKEI